MFTLWDLDLRLVRRRERAAIIISIASIVIPFGIGLGLAAYLHPEHAAAVSLLGAALSLTARSGADIAGGQAQQPAVVAAVELALVAVLDDGVDGRGVVSTWASCWDRGWARAVRARKCLRVHCARRGGIRRREHARRARPWATLRGRARAL